MKMIPLTNSSKQMIVDDKDYGWLSQFTWKLDFNGYPTCRNGTAHRVLFPDAGGMSVDHINRNKLDNRRSNLRVVTKAINNYNRPHSLRGKKTSKYRGVAKAYAKYPKWAANIKRDGVSYFLGSFRSEEEAARAYDKKAKELYGEYADLNFPD